jgi:hypothetical protein
VPLEFWQLLEQDGKVLTFVVPDPGANIIQPIARVL